MLSFFPSFVTNWMLRKRYTAILCFKQATWCVTCSTFFKKTKVPKEMPSTCTTVGALVRLWHLPNLMHIVKHTTEKHFPKRGPHAYNRHCQVFNRRKIPQLKITSNKRANKEKEMEEMTINQQSHRGSASKRKARYTSVNIFLISSHRKRKKETWNTQNVLKILTRCI